MSQSVSSHSATKGVTTILRDEGDVEEEGGEEDAKDSWLLQTSNVTVEDGLAIEGSLEADGETESDKMLGSQNS